MKKLALCAAVITLSGCVIFPMGGPASGTCIESEIDNFIGMQEIDLIATKAVMPVRVILPGTAITEDYSQARANFVIGADGRISDAYCG